MEKKLGKVYIQKWIQKGWWLWCTCVLFNPPSLPPSLCPLHSFSHSLSLSYSNTFNQFQSILIHHRTWLYLPDHQHTYVFNSWTQLFFQCAALSLQKFVKSLFLRASVFHLIQHKTTPTCSPTDFKAYNQSNPPSPPPLPQKLTLQKLHTANSLLVCIYPPHFCPLLLWAEPLLCLRGCVQQPC